MITAMIIWAYIFLLFYLYGQAVLTGLKRILRMDSPGAVELPLVLLTGVMTISVFAMIANLFIPLGAVFVFVLFTGALIVAFRKQTLLPVSFPSFHPAIWSMVVLIFLTVLENATHVPSNPDTGLYHAQTIRWFETYRIVPGLGNFQSRFAFNSSWLVLNAALSLAFAGLRSFHLVNGSLFLIVMLFFVDGVKQLEQKKLLISGFIKLLFIPLGFYLVASDVSSAGNDMPISLITWAILILWLERIESPVDMELRDVVIFLLSFFCVTVKLSSVFLLIFPIMLSVENIWKSDWRKVLILGAVGGLVLLPRIIRSAFLSGYLVFPVSQIDLLPVDWKMPGEHISNATADIVGFARLGLNWGSSNNMANLQWVSKWFNRQTLNRQMIYLLVLFSPILILAGRFIFSIQVSQKYLLTYGIALAGSLFWFLSAPAIRFGYGFLIGTCILAVVPMVVSVIDKFDKKLRIIPSLILLSLIAFQAYTLWRSIEPRSLSGRWLLPADYRSSNVETCDIKGGVVYCPREEAQCNYEAFPCMPYPRAVEMRGPTFQDGFRVVSATTP